LSLAIANIFMVKTFDLGIKEFRDSGIIEFRNSGIQVFRD